MSSANEAIERAGLSDILAARNAGDLVTVRAHAEALQKADLLVLGALADRIRKNEVGDDVRFVTRKNAAFHGVHVARGDRPGLSFLREVAIARITSDLGAAVRIDWDDAGFELAQVALGFGANELWGALANKRGLPIMEEEQKKVKGEGMVSLQDLKKRELARLLSYVDRSVVFDEAPVAEGAHDASAEMGEAHA